MNARVTFTQAFVCTLVLMSMALFGFGWTPAALGFAIGASGAAIGILTSPRESKSSRSTVSQSESPPPDGIPSPPSLGSGQTPSNAGRSGSQERGAHSPMVESGARPRARLQLEGPWHEPLIKRSLVGVVVLPAVADAVVPAAFGELSARDGATTVYAMHIAAATALGIVYLSSLIDWFYVRPRLQGFAARPMPCERSGHECWRGVTRVWLLHRLLAMLAFVIGLTVVVALAAYRWIDGIDDALATAIAAAATILAGFYLTRATSTLALAIRPALHVGDKVRIAEPFNFTEEDGAAPYYYVVDVALEGVRLLRLDASDEIHASSAAATAPAGGQMPEHDRLIDISDVTKLVRARGRFLPCTPPGGCKRVNPLCPYKLRDATDSETRERLS